MISASGGTQQIVAREPRLRVSQDALLVYRFRSLERGLYSHSLLKQVRDFNHEASCEVSTGSDSDPIRIPFRARITWMRPGCYRSRY
jgi:hypothetical protein